MYAEDSSNEMEVGEVCVYVGHEVSAYTKMTPRVVYQVVSKDDDVGTVTWCRHRYGLRATFDIAGHEDASVVRHVIGTRFLRRLDLVGLGLLRMQLDDFIRRHAVKLAGERGYDGTC